MRAHINAKVHGDNFYLNDPNMKPVTFIIRIGLFISSSSQVKSVVCSSCFPVLNISKWGLSGAQLTDRTGQALQKTRNVENVC